MKGHYRDVRSSNFFRSYVSTEAKNTANGLVRHSKERMSIVDSGDLSHMVELSSLNNNEKETIRRSSKFLDIQTANGIVVSDTQAKVFGRRFTISAIVGKIMQ